MAYISKEEHAALEKAKAKIRALNHPLRQKMLALIKQNKNRMPVTPIYKTLKIEQSIASLSLQILRNAKLVTTKKEGKFVYYSVDDKAINKLLEDCKGLVEN